MIDPNPLRMPADGVSTQPYLFAPPLLAKLQPIEPLFTPLPDANSQAKLYLSTLAARRTEAITALSSLSTPPNEVQSAVALYLALAAPFLTGMPDQQASSPSTEAAAAGAPGTLHGLSDVPATPPPGSPARGGSPPPDPADGQPASVSVAAAASLAAGAAPPAADLWLLRSIAESRWQDSLSGSSSCRRHDIGLEVRVASLARGPCVCYLCVWCVVGIRVVRVGAWTDTNNV